MKIATYNINNINSRLDVLLRWLDEAKPDIVCLQELKCEQNKFPESKLKAAGYNAVWQGQKSWNGVAILAKSEIKELRNDLPGEDEEYTHSRYIEAFIDGIVIGCIYLPNGNPWPGPKFDYKLRWFKRLTDHAENLVNRELPVILIGDYNVMPTDLDTYKPEKYINNALFRPESKKAYKNLVDQGWTDAIRNLYPSERIYTFWDYMRGAYGRNAGLRLDHFLLNKKIAKRLSAAQVDKHVRGWEHASDHAPVWIELADPDHAEKSKKAITDTTANSPMPAIKPETKRSAAMQDVETILARAPKGKVPSKLQPMKATLVREPFNDPGWLYEIKWDGYRALAVIQDNQAELISRNSISFDQFRPIAEALGQWNVNAVIDGEIVVLGEDGKSDFSAIQNWQRRKDGQLVYNVFDILWLEGRDLRDLPLTERKAVLETILPTDETIRLSKAFNVDGIEFFHAAEKAGIEGIMAKKADSTYTAGDRSKEWLKVKVERRQEVVIGAFTRNAGTEKLFSALAIGVYEKGVLRYIGKVGTGWSEKKQKEMMSEFEPLITDICPFDVEPDVDEPSQFRPRRLGAKPFWLKPQLVCEVNIAEITSDGKVRQASFKGMRKDKDPKDVVLEVPADTTETVAKADEMLEQVRTEPNPTNAMNKDIQPEASFLDPEKDSQTVKVNGCPLTFNHLSKVYWPEDGITKRDMFNYYDQVAEYMMPYLKDRPMSLNRFPNGIHGPSFYQKNVKDKVPDCMATMPHTNDKGEAKEYLVATNKASLLWMASLGCIEINPWFSRVQSPDNPDFCIIDLDPDKQHFDQVISAALEVKKVLDAIGVKAYPKTSGSTGMHIYIPLGAKYTYDQSQMFAKIIVTLVHKQIPEFTSLERMIKNRGGKMYLDFLQNRPDATIAGVYSLRPKPGATVSMPLAWDEVKPGLTMRHFTIHNSIARLNETGDLFKGVLGEGIDLSKTIKKAQEIFR
ncbi:bifunctional non-homologous end joining protein LigD [Mucilaginibacter gossypiicola]|uniref:DNA ligase (ATP) n=1 Tax=Mucilaginibacter gossypiicola TaxID=551995 RepID=A0A1H8D7H7_9SPHI|nr:DNA ligase D [Mucilaginibacter gossypiicola]SEN03273.1 bifunctional non-homologous end joining protein LigD [Mucilaginibacter gossypiicola]